MERILGKKNIKSPEDTDGFSKFKETIQFCRIAAQKGKINSEKVWFKKWNQRECGLEESRKKKMNVPIEMKTRLDAAERREDKPKTIGQVESNTETNS